MLRALAVAACTLALTTSVAFAQEVSFSPESGSPGTTITAEGLGFQPGETIQLRFAGVTLATGNADDEGFVRLTGTIPDAAPEGEHPVDLVGEASGTFGTTFLVVPAEAEPASPGATQDEGADDRTATPEATAGEERDATGDEEGSGFPWTPVALVATALLLAGGVTLARQRSAARRFCPSETRERIVVGTQIWASAVRHKGAWYDRPCVWRVWIGEKEAHYLMIAKCRLPEGHVGEHFYEDPPQRSPQSESEFFHDQVLRSAVVYYEDHDCKLDRESASRKGLDEHGDPSTWPTINGLTFEA